MPYYEHLSKLVFKFIYIQFWLQMNRLIANDFNNFWDNFIHLTIQLQVYLNTKFRSSSVDRYFIKI